MAFEIVLEKFSGPLHKLLELIEDKKYEITEVNLSKITGDFLEYLKEVESKEPRLLADFIVIASRLILIKSKSLIPELELTEEEEEEIRDLEQRLKLYKELKEAEEIFRNLWNAQNISFSRDPLPFEKIPTFIPSPNLNQQSFLNALATMHSSVVILKTQYENYDAVNFENYISELISRIGKNISKFGSVTENKGKKEVILLFLALLHLLKDNKISIDQSQSFSEITITPNQDE